MKLVVSGVKWVQKSWAAIQDQAGLIDECICSRDIFGLGYVFRARLSIADSLSQHLAQFSLRLPRFSRECRFLPVDHTHHVGMPCGKGNAKVTANIHLRPNRPPIMPPIRPPGPSLLPRRRAGWSPSALSLPVEPACAAETISVCSALYCSVLKKPVLG